MVIIRLARGGSKKRPFYHLVVTDSRNRRDGRYIERLGYFNPVARGNDVPLHMDVERIEHWQQMGAQMSDRVGSLVKRFKKGFLTAKPKKAKAAAPKAEAAEAAAE